MTIQTMTPTLEQYPDLSMSDWVTHSFVPSKLLVHDKELFGMKWWDYRFFTPFEATLTYIDHFGAEASYEFDETFQDKIAGIFQRDTSFAKRVTELIKPEYFTNAGTAEFVRMCQDHLKKFGNAPDNTTFVKLFKDLVAAKRIREDLIDGVRDAFRRSMKVDISNADFVADEVATFAKHQGIQEAMMKSLPLLEKGDFSKIRELMASACQIGLADDWEDYDYFDNIKTRTAKRDDIANGLVVRNGITTGYPKMDVHLYALNSPAGLNHIRHKITLKWEGLRISARSFIEPQRILIRLFC